MSHSENDTMRVRQVHGTVAASTVAVRYGCSVALLTSHDVFQRRKLDIVALVVAVWQDQFGNQSVHLLLFEHFQVILKPCINRSINQRSAKGVLGVMIQNLPLRLSNCRSRISCS